MRVVQYSRRRLTEEIEPTIKLNISMFHLFVAVSPPHVANFLLNVAEPFSNTKILMCWRRATPRLNLPVKWEN